jgi:hypothetical protein
MVTLSLALSISAFVIVAQNYGVFQTPANNPTSTPTLTTPTATPNISIADDTELTINYTETDKETVGGICKINYTITATYQKGKEITINYSDFSLYLYYSRSAYTFPYGTSYPKDNGTITLNTQHQTETFQVHFEFSSCTYAGVTEAGISHIFSYNLPYKTQIV